MSENKLFMSLLSLLPVVSMFVWNWKLGLGWLVLFLFAFRNSG